MWNGDGRMPHIAMSQSGYASCRRWQGQRHKMRDDIAQIFAFAFPCGRMTATTAANNKRRRRSHSVSVDSILAQQQILYYRHCHLLENLILYMCFDLLFLFLPEWMCASEREQAFGAGSFLSGLSNLKIKFSFLDLFRCLNLSACDFPFRFFFPLHFSLGVCGSVEWRTADGWSLSVVARGSKRVY